MTGVDLSLRAVDAPGDESKATGDADGGGVQSSAEAPVAPSAYRNFFDRYTADAAQPSASASSPCSSASPSSSWSSSSVDVSTRMFLLVSSLRGEVVGADAVLDSPFGPRPLLYADWTASGRALGCVERFLVSEVLPSYGNTHSSSSYSGLQTSLFRQEARELIGRQCGCGKDDVVLFTGTGSSGAMALLLRILDRLWREAGAQPAEVVVFLGPYQHHSILLPLREMGWTLRTVDEDLESGGVSLSHLRQELHLHAHSRFKLAVLSGASNVSGLMGGDEEAVSGLCSDYGALNVWDMATAAASAAVDMNPRRLPRLSKDAVVLSPHKLLGGVSTPGVLLVKKRLLLTSTPSTPAGGTVFFVTPTRHVYLENFSEREEGGTPDIVGAIRAGLAFQVRGAVDAQWRTERMQRLGARMRDRLMAEPTLQLMGNTRPGLPRLPIFSFLVRHPQTSLFLHPHFVSALLNDLFGVQTRSGCMCAGPYAMQCLGLTPFASAEVESALLRRMEIARPGFTRLSVHYSMTEEEVDFIADCAQFVARQGWQLLPLYGFHADSGEWRHRARMSRMKERRWLGNIDYSQGAFAYSHPAPPLRLPSLPLPELRRSLLEAAAASARSVASSAAAAFSLATDDRLGGLAEDCRHLRYFLLPAEALTCIQQPHSAHAHAHGKLTLNPPRTEEELRAIQSQWTAEQEERKQPPHSSALLPGSSPTTTAAVPATSLPPSPPPSLLSSLHAFEDDERLKRAKRAAEQRLEVEKRDEKRRRQWQPRQRDEEAKQQPDACGLDHCDSAGRGASSDSPVRPPQSHPPPSHIARASLSGSVCRHCFHRHWAQQQQKQCTSCDCISFEPLEAHAPLHSRATAFSLTASADVADAPSPSSSSSSSPFPPPPRVPRELSGLSKKLRSLVGRAILEYGMIREGDRVLVGVSGGKDSLTLLHVLLALRARSPVKFELGGVTVDPQTPEYDPSPLKAYFASLHLPYFYESQPIIANARSCMLTPARSPGSAAVKVSICAYCARMKRGLLYSALRREGWGVLALGQHADDLCESLLMSAFHNGLLRTMKAHYTIGAGDLRVIRPLAYVREQLTRRYAQLAALPVIADNCPACFAPPTERKRIKEILAAQEQRHPNVIANLLTAMKPLMTIRTAQPQAQRGAAATAGQAGAELGAPGAEADKRGRGALADDDDDV